MVGRQPFGGNRLSGTGTKAGGPAYLLQFVEPHVVTENTMRHGARGVELSVLSAPKEDAMHPRWVLRPRPPRRPHRSRPPARPGAARARGARARAAAPGDRHAGLRGRRALRRRPVHRSVGAPREGRPRAGGRARLDAAVDGRAHAARRAERARRARRSPGPRTPRSSRAPIPARMAAARFRRLRPRVGRRGDGPAGRVGDPRLPDRGVGPRGLRRARRRPAVGRLRARAPARRARSRRRVGRAARAARRAGAGSSPSAASLPCATAGRAPTSRSA